MHLPVAPSTTRTGRALEKLAEVVELRPEQAPALAFAAAFQFAFIAGVAVLKASSNALLANTSTLPWLYLAGAVTTGAVAALIVIRRVRRRWPPTLTFLAWVGVILALATGAWLRVPFAVEGLYLAVEIYATTLSVRFWTTMGELFDVRASRRVLGVVGGVGMAGSIAGGLLTRALGTTLGALNLVPIACLSLVACLALAPKLKPAPVTATIAPPVRRTERPSLVRDGLIRTMALLASLAAVTTVFGDFLFRTRAKQLLDVDAQVALYGEVSAAVGLVAMVVQLALTGPLLRRIGLFGFLALTPVGVLLFGAIAAFVPAMWPVYALRTVEQVGALSLTQTGMQLLYGPLPEKLREMARNIVGGIAKRGGTALGGGVLIVGAASLAPRTLPFVLIAAALASLVVTLRVRAHYIDTIGHRLRSPNEPESPEVNLRHGTARKLLEAALDSDDDGRVLVSLELLARDPSAKLEPRLASLLEHRSADVRALAAQLAGEKEAQSCAVRLAELANTDTGAVREAAIGAVAKLRPFTAARLLAPLLAHDDLQVRAAVICALVPLDPNGPAGDALHALLDKGPDASPDERAQVAKLLGSLGGAYARRLRPYLHDPSAQVRIAACRAAGEATSTELTSDLLELLVSRETRAEARSALAKYGDSILSTIERLLNERQGSADMRYRLPRLLREVATPRALEIILFSNVKDDPFLQFRLATAAGHIKERQPDIAFDRKRAIKATGRRIDAYMALLPMARDLAAALGPKNPLVRVVNDRLDQCLESAVRLAGLLYPQRALQNAYNRFVHGDAKTRPYAIELLEHVIEDRELSRRLVGCLERWHRRPDWRDEGRIDRAPARLIELVGSADPLLRAFAITTVRSLQRARAEARPPSTSEGSGIHLLASLASGPAWDLLLSAPPAIPEEGSMSENVVERVLFLEGVDIFAESDVDDLAALARCVQERTYEKGEVIYFENDPGDALFVIIEGTVRVDHEGRHIVDLGPRDSFGETSLLDHKPRPATTTALTPVRVLVLERADFMDLIADRVELLRGIFRALTKHLRSVLDAAAAGRITSPGLTPVSVPRAHRSLPGEKAG